jgi:DoxX-like family
MSPRSRQRSVGESIRVDNTQPFNKEKQMSPKAKQITGWVLTGLVGLFLIGLSSVGKFTDWPDKEVMFKKIGVPMELSQTLGVIEVAVTVLFLIPRTSFIGAILVTGYLGGAVWTHLRVGDPWFFPIIIGVVMWVALGMRQPAIFVLAMGKSLSQPDSGAKSP